MHKKRIRKVKKYRNRELVKSKNRDIEKYKNRKIQIDIYRKYGVQYASFENNPYMQTKIYIYIIYWIIYRFKNNEYCFWILKCRVLNTYMFFIFLLPSFNF